MSADSFAEAALPNLTPSSSNVAGPQDQIMLEPENALVSSIVRQSAVMLIHCCLCSVDTAFVCASRVQLPQFTEQITSTSSPGTPHR